MSEPLHLFGISGSLRRASFNTGLMHAVRDELPEGMTLDLYDRLGEIPPYDEDVRTKGVPEPVADLRERIGKAHALVIATPEYNYSIPGVLKNAIDWASRPPHHPFAGKAVAILGAAGSRLGTARAQYHLRQVCVYLDMHPLNKPEVFVSMAPEKFDADGKLTDDATRKMIKDLLVALGAWTLKLSGKAGG
jgi:chromate reductase